MYKSEGKGLLITGS